MRRSQRLTASFVVSLKELESTLGTLQGMSGNCLQELENQVKRQREIKSNLKTNVKNDLVQTLMDIALNCDVDQDDRLSDEEIERLVHKLEGIHGIDVREQKIRQMVADHGRNVFCKWIYRPCYISRTRPLTRSFARLFHPGIA